MQFTQKVILKIIDTLSILDYNAKRFKRQKTMGGISMLKKEQKKKSHIKFRIIFSIATLLIIVSTIVVAAASNKKYTISINDGGNEVLIETTMTDITQILDSFEIEVGPDDSIDASSFIPGEGGEIVIKRGCNITVNDHGKKIEVMARGTVYEVLEELGIKTDRNDVIDINICEYVKEGMTINIDDGVEIKIKRNEKEMLHGVPVNSTVEEALNYAGIEMGADDELSVDKKQKVSRNMTVEVFEIEYKESTAVKEIEFKTIEKKSTEIGVGKTKVVQEGVNGKKEVTYTEKYINGKYDKRTVASERVMIEAKDKIVLVGVEKATTKAVNAMATVKNTTSSTSEKTTNKKATTTKKASTIKTTTKVSSNSSIKTISNFTLPSKYTLNSSKVPTKYKKKMTGSATAYYGGTSTSIGKKPQPGYIAVNPKIIPYGTEMWIVSNDGKYIYGYAIAADTGGFIYSGTTIADLYFNTYNECINFGRRNITIYIL